MPKELHQKRTRVDSSRPTVKFHPNFVCTKSHQEEILHVPLEGRWRGIALTEWAEDYPARLALSMADGLDLPRQTRHQAKAGITMDQEVVEDQAVVQVLDSLRPGEYVASDFGSVELDILELHTSIEVTAVSAKAGAVTWPQSPENVTRRSTMVKNLTDWIDLEGAIILTSQTPVGTELPLEVEVAVFIFGGPLLRLRARQLPRDGREHECMAWLRRYHIGTAHGSPAEMAQAIRDAGGSRYLQRLAITFKCAICAIDALPRGRYHAVLPIRARFFNAVIIIGVGDVEFKRIGVPTFTKHLLFIVDSFAVYSRRHGHRQCAQGVDSRVICRSGRR